jgi:8-oxo-dGTP diphosphatase
MEAVQPRVRNATSEMAPAVKFAESLRISPQTGFDTSTTTAGGGNSPTLRGFWKWSIKLVCSMTTVVAAVISRGQEILVCQRRANGAHPLKWEFPGGKVEEGETLAGALYRELKEELGIVPLDAQEIARYQYAYPGKQPIQLVFFEVGDFSGDAENRVFQNIEWSQRSELISYDFLEGDVDFVRSLISTEFR